MNRTVELTRPYQIRPAVQADAVALPDIERSAGALFRTIRDLAWIADDAVLPQSRHADLIAKGTVWVAARDERLSGFLSAEPFGSELHIWALAVAFEAQGDGIGRALMGTAKRWARANTYSAMTLTTFRDVPWNEHFYAGLGFRILESPRLTPHLEAALAAEAAAGLPAKQRCAMRLVL